MFIFTLSATSPSSSASSSSSSSSFESSILGGPSYKSKFFPMAQRCLETNWQMWKSSASFPVKHFSKSLILFLVLNDLQSMQNLTKRILNCLSNLQPSKKEDEFKDQEDWNEGVGVRGLDLAAYQRQGEVDPDCKPNGFFKYLVIFLYHI